MQQPNQPPYGQPYAQQPGYQQQYGQPGYPAQLYGQPPGYQSQPYSQPPGYQPQPYGQPGYPPQYMAAGPVAGQKRPTFVTVVCVIMMIGLAIGLLGLLGILAFITVWPVWFVAYYVINLAVRGVSVFGLWNMKKWGVILYVASFVIDIILSAVVGYGFGFTTILPVAVIAIGFIYWKQME